MMRCTAEVKPGVDPAEQMRAAQPMSRGERLVEWEMRRDVAGPPRRKWWYRLFTGSLVAFAVADKRLSHMPAIERIRLHAAPLALARERRRRERAETRLALERRVSSIVRKQRDATEELRRRHADVNVGWWVLLATAALLWVALVLSDTRLDDARDGLAAMRHQVEAAERTARHATHACVHSWECPSEHATRVQVCVREERGLAWLTVPTGTPAVERFECGAEVAP